MVRTCGDAKDLLLRCAVEVVHPHSAVGIGGCGRLERSDGRSVVPVFAVVVELRKQTTHVGKGRLAQLIIGASREAKARPVVPILAYVLGRKNGLIDAVDRQHSWKWFNVLNRAVVMVIAAAQQKPKLFFCSRPP